jgi:hypothetical protein
MSSPAQGITHMDKKGREEVELELQVLKQELVVQHLTDKGEPTDEAQELLERVRAKCARGGKAAFGPVGWPRGPDLILSFGPAGTLLAC